MLSNFTLEQKIGQRLAAGFPDRRLMKNSRPSYALQDRQCDSISHNVADKHQLAALCQEIRALVREATGIDPFITIDQEEEWSPDSPMMPPICLVRWR